MEELGVGVDGLDRHRDREDLAGAVGDEPARRLVVIAAHDAGVALGDELLWMEHLDPQEPAYEEREAGCDHEPDYEHAQSACPKDLGG